MYWILCNERHADSKLTVHLILTPGKVTAMKLHTLRHSTCGAFWRQVNVALQTSWSTAFGRTIPMLKRACDCSRTISDGCDGLRKVLKLGSESRLRARMRYKLRHSWLCGVSVSSCGCCEATRQESRRQAECQAVVSDFSNNYGRPVL